VHIHFLNVIDVTLCVEPVKGRVHAGGHNIPEEVIRRRYYRAQKNFEKMYKRVADHWCLFDASEDEPTLIATNEKIEDTAYIQRYWSNI
jgi:predicted ABC-type ATPase